METTWVYKADGTLQCGLGREIPLEVMQKELETVVGKPLRAEKRIACEMLPTVCGAPTGHVNAYELTAEQAYVLFRGIVGPMGFKPWTCGEAHRDGAPDESHVLSATASGPEVPFPLSGSMVRDGELSAGVGLNLWAGATDAVANPVLVRELIGRPCRVYEEDSDVTLDLRPMRVNIVLGKDRRIRRIWFG